MIPIFALALLALPAFAAFPNGYSYCKVVTTSATMVSGTSDLINYPLTVILTDNDLRTVVNSGFVNNANGYDIGFYPDCSGSGTALKWEMESYSATTGAIVAHVLRPIFSHIANDTLGMYYGGAFISFQSTASAVWDGHYLSVWHLPNGMSLSANDSTSHGNKATTINASPAPGMLDGAASFNGSNQYISLPFSVPASLSLGTAVTISGWFKGSLIQSMVRLQTTGPDYIILGLGTTNPTFIVSSDTPGVNLTNTAQDGLWHYAAGVWAKNTTNGLRAYLDGAVVNQRNSRNVNLPSGTYTTWVPTIGALNAGASEFTNGTIDEVRISDIARSADWILTEYRNQSVPGTYISTGPRIIEASHVRHIVIGGI